jgi:GNAT superfamily N-acetyltransferase
VSDPTPSSATPTAQPAGAAERHPPPFRWVPVRSLAPRHRPRILEHLLELDVHDRHLRFGHTATDEMIAAYVEALDFRRDEVFGIFNRRLQLVAMAHLAYARADSANERERSTTEFAVSVHRRARGRGYGSRLFEHAVMHARNRGIQTMYVHALTENTPMLRIARSHGSTVERDGSESDAYLKLPPEDLGSHLEEALEAGAAEVNYRLKSNALRFGQLLEIVDSVRQLIARFTTREPH